MELKCENLSVGYTLNKKKITLIKDINMDFVSGTVSYIIGKNGCGKSTFFKTLSNVIKPLSGQISITEKNSFKREELFSAMYTGFPNCGEFTAYEVAAMGRSRFTGFFGILNDTDKLSIDNAMKFCECLELRDKVFNSLSDGQKQKVIMARTLCCDTDIIILDEPSAFLDFDFKDIFFDKLEKYAIDNKKIVLVSTHDIKYLDSSKNKLFIIDNQKLKCYI